jgi:hypothetical protein
MIAAAPRLPMSLEYGLDDFARKPPLWPMSPGMWHAIIADVRRFADRWHSVAIGQGWTIDQLYGLHRQAPGTSQSSETGPRPASRQAGATAAGA